MRLYVALVNDILWSRGMTEVAGRRGPERVMEMGALLSLVREDRFPFTERTRTTAFLLERTGLLFEAYAPYRLFWRFVKLARVAFA